MNEKEARLQRDVVTVRLEEPLDASMSGWVTAGLSSIIGTRNNQQDSLYIKCGEKASIGIVCDGMGGMEGGELASQTAVKILAEDFETYPETKVPWFLRQEAVKMDEAVAELTDTGGRAMNAGTTIVAIIIQGNQLYWLSVGDSRIYIMRQNEFIQVNRDHNYKMRLDAQREADMISEEEYYIRMEKGEALISYIGMGDVSLMDINQVPFPLIDGDVVLLCSDGLYKRLENEEIQEIIQSELPDVDEAANKLTRIVMDRTTGSQDNTSVILMQYNQYSNI